MQRLSRRFPEGVLQTVTQVLACALVGWLAACTTSGSKMALGKGVMPELIRDVRLGMHVTELSARHQDRLELAGVAGLERTAIGRLATVAGREVTLVFEGNLLVQLRVEFPESWSNSEWPQAFVSALGPPKQRLMFKRGEGLQWGAQIASRRGNDAPLSLDERCAARRAPYVGGPGTMALLFPSESSRREPTVVAILATSLYAVPKDARSGSTGKFQGAGSNTRLYESPPSGQY